MPSNKPSALEIRNLQYDEIIEKEEPDLIFVQEPYEYQNRPVGIEKKCRVFTAGNGKRRAAICIPNNKTDAMLITQTSNEDTVVLEIIHKKIKFFTVSMYIDIDLQIENSFTNIDEILQFAKGARILIATVSNARSKTWNDKITNSRGKKLEEYLASRHLHIINEESEMFTFHNSRRSGNIDLTITNNNLIADYVNGKLVKKRAVRTTISSNIKSEIPTVIKTNTTTEVEDM